MLQLLTACTSNAIASKKNVRNAMERQKNESRQYYSFENNGFLFFFIEKLVPGSGRNDMKDIKRKNGLLRNLATSSRDGL